MRKTLLSTLIVAVLLGASSTYLAQEAAAADLKPVVTVAFAGYDELKADIAYIGKLGGNPHLANGLEALLTLVTGGQGVAGLDKSKPWGVVVQTDGADAFPIYGFVPVTDLKQLMGLVKDPATGEAPEPEDGVYKIDAGIQTVLVTEKDGWAFIANDASLLANLPSDPTKALGGLNEKYDLAVRASIQNVPAMYRQLAVSQLKQGAELALMQLPEESDEDYAIRSGVAKQGIEQLVTVINDLDQILLGFTLDRDAGTTYLDFEVTAVEGSKTAADFAQLKEAKTNFAGFDLPGAAVTGNWASMLSDSDVTQFKSLLADVRTRALQGLEDEELPDELTQLGKQVLTDLLDVAEKTVANKVGDGGAVLILKPGVPTFVAGGVIAESAKLEKVLKQLAEVAVDENPDFAQLLKLDAETHEGVRFHKFTLPVPDEDAAKALGEQVDIVIGIGETSLYLAAGSEATETLKQVIDKSKAEAGKTIPPMRIVVALTPIMKFAAEVVEGPEALTVAMFAEEIAKSEGKDHITLTSKAIPNGASVRVEIEEGILKVLGKASQMSQEMPVGGDDEAVDDETADDDPF